MPRQLQWTSERIGMVRRMIRHGATIDQVAHAIGAKNGASIRTSLRKYGIAYEGVSPANRVPMSEEGREKRRQAMRAYYEKKEASP